RDGAAARGRQAALVGRLAHQRMTDAGLGRLLDKLAAHRDHLADDDDDARLIDVTRRDFEKAIKVPAALVERLSEAGSASYAAWTRARPENDFAVMRPHLETLLDISREYAELFAP